MVELAIVILIMGLLLSGLMMPLSVQRENAKLRDAREQLLSVRFAIDGFALVNGFLPCPATPSSAGLAAPSGGGCAQQHGFVPATTLDLNGQRNTDNLLLDPWGSALRYSVSTTDINANGNWDFTTAGDMQIVTMPLLSPDLTVCSSGVGSSPMACNSPGVTLTAQAPALVYSLGRDWSSFSSADELENVGASISGGPSGVSYPVASDVVFVFRGSSDLAGNEFDDIIVWLSPNRLYGKLVDAGHLP